MSADFVETFPALSSIDDLLHGFVLRDPQTPTDSLDRAATLNALQPHICRSLATAGVDFDDLALAEQVHGSVVARVGEDAEADSPVPSADGLLTDRAGVTLGIFVADCCAVFLVDPVRRACALLHSGRKGSEAAITSVAIGAMARDFGTQPEDLVAVLSPCIRPPHYEVDFAAMIREQCAAAGIETASIHDSGADTAADLSRYYSYRMEKGRTGRMLAFLGWRKSED